MYNFNRDNRGNNRFGGRRDFSDRSMHRTTCSKCGNECEVPFRPTGERPVYCSKCFEGNRRSDPRRFEDRNTGGKYDNVRGNSDGQYKKQFETLNWKLDKILKMITPVVAPAVVQEEKIEKNVKGLKPKKSSKSTKLAKKEQKLHKK